MEHTEYYAQSAAQGQYWWFVSRTNIIRRVLRRVIGVGDKRSILDIGCGTGSNASMLREFGQVTGVDPAPEAALFSRSFYDVFVAGDISKIEKNRRFDIVTLFDILEHVAHDTSLLMAVAAHLRPEGRLVITVPAFPFLWSAHDVHVHHLRRYTRRALLRKLEAAGYHIEYMGFMFMILFPIVICIRMFMRFWQQATGRRPAPHNYNIHVGLNALLTVLIALEAKLIPQWSLPFGSSLICVARMVDGNHGSIVVDNRA